MNTQLKSILRSFRKYPAFSAINLGGLAIGIAASFIILVYSQRELSCDRHFPDAGRIVRIGTDFYQLQGPSPSAKPMLRDLSLASCKDVQDATAIDAGDETPIRTSPGDRAFTGHRGPIISILPSLIFSPTRPPRAPSPSMASPPVKPFSRLQKPANFLAKKIRSERPSMSESK